MMQTGTDQQVDNVLDVTSEDLTATETQDSRRQPTSDATISTNTGLQNLPVLRSPRGLKLRSSCNNCNLAKIKCSKSKPTCERCATRRIKCVYGVSLRSVGRRNIGSRGSTCTDSPQSPTRTTRITGDTAVPVPGDFGNLLSFEDSDLQSLQQGEEHLPLSSLIHETPSTSSLATSLATSSSISAFGASLTDQWNELCSNFTTAPGSSSTESDFSKALEDATRSAADSSHWRDIRGKSTMSTSIAPNCGCQQTLAAKLTHLSSLSQSIADIPFDRFLIDNKNIISLCSEVLKCPSRSLHGENLPLLITFTAILSQLILLFDHKLTSEDNHSPTLFFGSYQLDQRDEQVLRSELAKMELLKISGIVDAFKQQYCGPGSGHGGGFQQLIEIPAATMINATKGQQSSIGPLLSHIKELLQSTLESVGSLEQ